VYRYSIIVCARWETPYIAEWLAYYETLGFDHIYLYCNDDDPTELSAAVASATRHNPKFVSFTHFLGQGRQRDMYLAAMVHARRESEWVTFLDIDEFLVLRGCDDIKKFMAPFQDTADSIHFNWIYFGNNGFLQRPSGSVLQQYTQRTSFVNPTTKHITRTEFLDVDRLAQPAHPPFWHGLPDPVWHECRRVNVLGADMAPLLVDYPAKLSIYLADAARNYAVFAKAVVNHYAMKSEADFLLRFRRGTLGEFGGQVVWKQAYESGKFRDTLASMNEIEDVYLRDFSLRQGAVGGQHATTPSVRQGRAAGTDTQSATVPRTDVSAPAPQSQRLPGKHDMMSQPTGRDFTKRRVLVINHRGNLANKMFQYMGALSLARLIKDCEIVNVSLPEWGISIPDDTYGQQFFNNVDLQGDWFTPDLQEFADMANRSESIRIVVSDYLQKMEFLLDRSFYNSIFVKSSSLEYQPKKDDLVINIRTGDILRGIAHYPLVPVSFYEHLVSRTGLNPVFIGQLQPSEYVTHLRSQFPTATFIDSRGAKHDFDFLRSATNIVVSVSTFSWLAAWLSDAKTIILPLTGFYNPAHHRETDLLPVDDIRYRYFLFPLNYGMPPTESLAHHERMKGHWKEISRNQVAVLKTSTPFLRLRRESDSGQPVRAAHVPIDNAWYAHEYIDAAMEISEGWFEDPLHHYLEVGRLRGYSPTRPMQADLPANLTLANLALNKRATQSSLSQWSVGATLAQDAANAVNGNPAKDFGFHTDQEHGPWWMVDLGGTARIGFIRIFNRNNAPLVILQRASPLVVEASHDGIQWQVMFRTRHGQVFGGYGGGRPLVWSAPQPVEARFIKISIPRHEVLHLAEVEIYGNRAGD
jgi:hypothetical protein